MKRGQKPGHPRRSQAPPVLVGYAWYKEDQWDRLQEVCPDSKDFPDSHQEWLEFANQRFEQLTRKSSVRA